MKFFFVSYLVLVNCSALYNNQPKKFKAAPKKNHLKNGQARHMPFATTRLVLRAAVMMIKNH